MEVSCSRCQRRYAVADDKVAGRRRTSRCRCGNLLIFDGRTLSGAGLDVGTSESQPLEPTLTPSEARTEATSAPRPEAHDLPSLSSAAPSDEARSNAEVPPDEPPPAEGRSLAAEPSPDSQSIGRIRLRKAELRPAEATPERLRPRAPSTRVEHAESRPPESPRSLHEAFDSLDLDRLADAIRPAWEAPPSRRVTSPGDDPEVIVHYPSEWQPSPSERRRMRASWEVTPTLPLSFAPPPSDTLDDDWDAAPGDAAPASAQAAPSEAPAASDASADEPPKAVEARILERPAADSVTALAPEPAPEGDTRVGKSGGPGLESTAPTAVSQPAPVARRSSRAKLWGAGVAAAALMALVWRGSGSSADTPVAGADAPKSAAIGQVAARTDSVPASPPPAPAPAPAIAEDVEPASETAASPAPASASAAGAPPATPAAPPAPVTPAPLAEAPRVSVARTPPRRHTPTNEALAPAAVAAPASGSTAQVPEARDAEQTGPDPREVAQALGTAAARARACSASDGSAGSGSIRVLLNPAGGVLNATALGEFQGTSAGACVENAFRDAQTPAYQGRSLSTVYPFNLIVD